MMEADILLFMGQSNMAGRGDDQLAPKVLPGAAYGIPGGDGAGQTGTACRTIWVK